MFYVLQERERLQAMMTHLHLNKKKVKTWQLFPAYFIDICLFKEEERKAAEQRENGLTRSPPPAESNDSKHPQPSLHKPLGFGPPLPNMGFPSNIGSLGGFPGPRPPGFGFLPPGGGSPGLQGPIRRRITDKTPMSLPSGKVQQRVDCLLQDSPDINVVIKYLMTVNFQTIERNFHFAD